MRFILVGLLTGLVALAVDLRSMPDCSFNTWEQCIASARVFGAVAAQSMPLPRSPPPCVQKRLLKNDSWASLGPKARKLPQRRATNRACGLGGGVARWRGPRSLQC